MDVKKVDHIGIAVKNIEESLKFYKDVLGIECTEIEEVTEQKVKVAFLPIGDTELELLESTDKDGPIVRFIEKKGEGMQDKGIRMIDEKPRYGAGGAKIAFCHPKSTGGVLVELSER